MLEAEPGQGEGPAATTGRAVARVLAPALIALAGIVLLTTGEAALGVVMLAIAGLVLAVDWLARLSLRSQRDREREQSARERFARTGEWPTS